MDLINQNKFKNLLIIVLLAVNLLTVSVIWIQASSGNDVDPARDDKHPQTIATAGPGSGSESVQLMKQVLSLSDEQVKQLNKIRAVRLDEAKKYNDSLDLLKKQLAEELFREKPDSILALNKSLKIGQLQAKVEMIRFRHFNELLELCSTSQKEKLKPVLTELFGRKPPKNISESKPQPVNKKVFKPGIATEDTSKRPADFEMTTQKENAPAPPSIDEKLEKYSKRLNLTLEQKEKVRSVLQHEKQKNAELRKRRNPDPIEIENEKEKNRKEEDESIMQLLNDEQKNEFSKMIMNRRKNPENRNKNTENRRQNKENEKKDD